MISQIGEHQGLSVLLDAHSDVLADSSVPVDFKGFTVHVSGKLDYPWVKRNGRTVGTGRYTQIILDAIDITADKSLRSSDPLKRKCYFDNEKELIAHKHYRYQNCVYECSVAKATSVLAKNGEKCIPWQYIPLEKDMPLCNPWQTQMFVKTIESMFPLHDCPHCLQDCESTSYDYSMFSTSFVKCRSQSLNKAGICGTSLALNPSMVATSLFYYFSYPGSTITSREAIMRDIRLFKVIVFLFNNM